MEILNSLLESLKIEPAVLLANGILFLILLQIMSAIFWKPMMRHLEKRREEISHAYRSVDETRREMETLRGEYQSRLSQIEAEARGRIQETVRDAQRQREALIAEARAEAERTVREGGQTIEQDKARAVVQMREQLDDVAEQALAKALGGPVDAAQRRLVDDYIAERVIKSS